MLSKWATSFELPCSPCAAQDGRVRFNPNLYVNGKVGNSMRVMFAVCAAVWLFLGGRVYGLLNLFGCHSALSRGLPFDLGTWAGPSWTSLTTFRTVLLLVCSCLHVYPSMFGSTIRWISMAYHIISYAAVYLSERVERTLWFFKEVGPEQPVLSAESGVWLEPPSSEWSCSLLHSQALNPISAMCQSITK